MVKRSDRFKENLIVTLIGVTLFWALFNYKLLLGALDFVTAVLAPFITGAVLTLILNVPMSAIERRLFRPDGQNRYTKAAAMLKRPVSLLLTYLLLAGVLVLVLYLVIPEFIEAAASLSAELPRFMKRVGSRISENEELSRWIKNMNISIDREKLTDSIQKLLQDGVIIRRTVSSTVSAASGVISGVVNFVIGIVFSVYMLLNKEKLKNQLYRLTTAFLPQKYAQPVCRVCRLSKKTFSDFLSGQCIEAVILGTLCCIGMTIFGFPNALTIGMLVAVTAFIPIVGGFIGVAVGAFFIMVSDFMQAVWFVVFMIILQQIEGNVIYPRVVGQSVGLPPLWVLFAVTCGGALGGIGGMFLGVPVCSVLYCILRETADHLNREKGIEDPPKPEVKVINRKVRSEDTVKKNGVQNAAKTQKPQYRQNDRAKDGLSDKKTPPKGKGSPPNAAKRKR